MKILSQDCNSTYGFTHDLRVYDSTSLDVMHIHRAAELIALTAGSLEVKTSDGSFTLEPGEAALVLPFEPHAFTCEKARFYVHLFHERYAEDFYKALSERRSELPKFTPSEAAFGFYSHCYGLTPSLCPELSNDLKRVDVTCADFTSEAGLSAMLSEFLTQCELASDRRDSFRRELLSFLEAHYREELPLERVAAEFGYEPHYLSKRVRRSTGMKLSELIVGFRIDAVKRMLAKGGMSMTEIAQESGFGSLRTLDRSFRAAVGCSPQGWRNNLCR